MAFALSRRSLFICWLTVTVLFVVVALYPLSNLVTRSLGIALFALSWIALLSLSWSRRAARSVLLTLSAFCALFPALPARRLPDRDALRNDYVRSLRRYDGVRYIWGGESPMGIDCSGLIRRGLIDSLFLQGIRTADPGLVRRALSLWWGDCTARVLGQGAGGATAPLQEAASINRLDHSGLLPGDLAVTRNGLHIMAYLGNAEWIEADPGASRVLTVRVPTSGNAWFDEPMRIVRWSVLQP